MTILTPAVTTGTDGFPPAGDRVRAASGDAVGVLRGLRPGSCGEAELIDAVAAVEELGRVVDGARTVLAGEVGARSVPGFGSDSLAVKAGCRDGRDLLSRVTRVSDREARRRLRLGEELTAAVSAAGVRPIRFPGVADAIREGTLGVDAAEAITDGLGDAAPRCGQGELAAAERALIACAAGVETDDTAGLPGCGIPLPADLVRAQALVWRARLDPDGAAPCEEASEPVSTFGFGRLRRGVYPLRGAVTPELRAVLDGVFAAHIAAGAPRFTPAPDEASAESGVADDDALEDAFGGPAADVGAGHDDEAADSGDSGEASTVEDAAAFAALGQGADLRSTDQKRADILRAIFDAAGRSPDTPRLGGAAPVPVIHINARDLNEGVGVGWIDGETAPVSMRSVKQAICSGGHQTVIFGDDGEILHLGRAARCFTPAQRRALAARDGGCVIPGCTVPARWCETHHVIPWQHGGRTDIDNGVLLCWHHHHTIDTSGWVIRMIRGKPHVKAPGWLDHTRQWHPVPPHRARTASAPTGVGAPVDPQSRQQWRT